MSLVEQIGLIGLNALALGAFVTVELVALLRSRGVARVADEPASPLEELIREVEDAAPRPAGRARERTEVAAGGSFLPSPRPGRRWAELLRVRPSGPENAIRRRRGESSPARAAAGTPLDRSRLEVNA